MINQLKKLSGYFIIMTVAFIVIGCSEEQTVVSPEKENIEAVQAVLESEFTVPSEEYVTIVKNIDKKMKEIGSSTPEANDVNGEVESGVSDEWLAYEDLVEKTYGPYFTDAAFDKLISNTIAFHFHYGYLGYDENVQYTMNVSDIQITKSENENTPNFYDFSAQVEYTDNAGVVSKHEVKGMAILSEPGKIGKFELKDNGGLDEKVSADR